MSTLAQIEIKRTQEYQKGGSTQAKNSGVYKGRKMDSKNKDLISSGGKDPKLEAFLQSDLSIDITVSTKGVSRSKEN
jgi:DNA invertase Pin-like site-specific DNA recombinase